MGVRRPGDSEMNVAKVTCCICQKAHNLLYGSAFICCGQQQPVSRSEGEVK